ncbi:hypothetical protein HanIR_Chr12g0568951 [Helianthus annuus]|nr:hypothetical protein HanIR_Chr12g0568951 [Helianthus annuus]
MGKRATLRERNRAVSSFSRHRWRFVLQVRWRFDAHHHCAYVDDVVLLLGVRWTARAAAVGGWVLGVT